MLARTFARLLLLALASASASAHSHDHQHEHRHGHNAAGHQHGTGQLDLVLEGQQLLIELQAPADDLLGFEHAPRTPEQHQQVADLQHTLRQPQLLFRLPEAARCRLDNLELHSPLFAATPPSANDGHAGEHADIRVHYQFNCARTEQLQQIEVILFEQFPGSNQLLLQAITPNGQQGGELSAGHNRIRF